MRSAGDSARPAAGRRRVLVRADGGPGIGAGHVERCLALADGLRRAGAHVQFLCAQLDRRLRGRIEGAGLPVLSLPEPRAHWREATEGVLAGAAYDVLVVDHYGIGADDEAAFAAHVERLVVIEDLPERRHACDVLLDQTVGRSPEAYRGLVPPAAELLLGSDYALVRRAFGELRDEALRKRAPGRPPRRLLVSLGGSNPADVVARLAKLLAEHQVHKHLDVRFVLGLAADAATARRVREHLGEPACLGGHVERMHELVLWADLAIGGAGVSTWERCVLGLPSVLLVLADNQREIARNVVERGAALAGGGLELDEGAVLGGLERLRADAALRRRVAAAAFALCDGAGVERASAAILAAGDAA